MKMPIDASAIARFSDQLVPVVLLRAVKILVLIFAGYLFEEILRKGIEHLTVVFRRTLNRGNEDEADKRARTLSGIVGTSARVALWGTVFMLVLGELEINLGAVVAGVGIAGLALGFGAQNLVKDVVTGFFILLENQYGVGDVISICGVNGFVEEMTLRFTKLRDLSGNVHIVPHGQVGVVTNMTKDWSRISLSVRTDYDADPDRVIAALEDECRRIKSDPRWEGLFLEVPQVLGVDGFDDSGVNYLIIGKTKPIKQWELMREFRKRVLQRFKSEGILIPAGLRTISVRAEPPSGSPPAIPPNATGPYSPEKEKPALLRRRAPPQTDRQFSQFFEGTGMIPSFILRCTSFLDRAIISEAILKS